jgi:hypothetical protein
MIDKNPSVLLCASNDKRYFAYFTAFETQLFNMIHYDHKYCGDPGDL